MLAPLQWPYAPADAIAAQLYRTTNGQLGVAYTYADGVGEAGPVAATDWPIIRRLQRAGKLTFRDSAAQRLATHLVAHGCDR
jgi:hypothetical protein